MSIVDDIKSVFGNSELKDNFNETVKLNAEYIKQLEDVLDSLLDFDETIQLLNEHLEKTIELQGNSGGGGSGNSGGSKGSDKTSDSINKLKEAIGSKSKNTSGGAVGKASAGGGMGKGVASAATKGIGKAISKALSKALMKGIMTAVKGLNIATMILGILDGVAAKVIEYGAELYERHQQKKVIDLQQEQNLWRANAEAQLAGWEAGGKILTRNMQAAGKTQQAVLSSATAQITQGAQEGAFAAAKAMGAAGANAVKSLFDNQMDLLVAQNTAAKASLRASQENFKLEQERARINDKYIEDAKELNIFDFQSADATADAAVKMREADRSVALQEKEIAYEKAQYELQIEEKKAQIIRDAVNAAMEIAQGAVDQVLDLTKAVEKVFNETEKQAKATAAGLGIGGNMVKEYTDNFFKTAKNLKFNDRSGQTIYLDKDAKDMAKLQSTYSDATGRNQMMGQEDMVKSFQLGRVLGDDNLAATLLGDMDYFNKSIAEGTDLIYDMFQKANKAGVSNKKFAKDLQKNLKLAQKYTFKGGVKGMMEMSIWAQKTRFNMESLGDVVEKGLKGGLEGAIQQSAKLQVLGGKAGMLSNPLAMLYEFGNDPGAAAKRINEMTEGFGRFNKKTGEVDFSMSDTMQLRAIAEAYGMDPTELRNQATQKIKSKEIDKHISANYNDEQKSLIYNKAQLDQETGKWMVTMANGEKRDINQIGDNEWAQLMPTEEAIEDYVSKIYDLLAQTLGAQNYSNAVLADGTKDILTDEQKKRIDNSLTLVHENYETTSNLIRLGAEHATISQKNANDALIASTATVTKMFKVMELSQIEAIKQMNECAKGHGKLYNALGLVEAKLTGNEGAVAKFEAALLGAAASLGMVSGGAGGGSGSGENGSVNTKMGQAVNEFFKYKGSSAKEVENLRDRLNNWKKNDGTDAGLKDILTDGWDDFLDAAHNAGAISGDSMEYWSKDKTNELISALNNLSMDYYEKKNLANNGKLDAGDSYGEMMYHMSSNPIMYKDGFAQSNGGSMLTSGAKVTPINDGSVQLAKSHPQDSAIFAKAGGPFDTLFNKVFSKVDTIYNSLSGNGSSPTQSVAPIQLNINGELNLKSDGQSVDLLSMIQNNPTFLATMSQMIVTQLSKNVNGGKTSMFDWLRSIK